jgi:hypothetical protein
LAREDLESGITTVRNLGHSGVDGDTELRDAINAGRVSGPRILASASKLITRGEYVQSFNPALAEAILQQEFFRFSGPLPASKDSFVLGPKAAATWTPENMLQGAERSTRLNMATSSVAEAYNHCGQMVEYLRMNGIVPPGEPSEIRLR